jgi:hypothetical protein
MGYLDNSSITVDAVLTKRGRELLSKNNNNGNGSSKFQITMFALGDDEIDYSLFNESHPNGTQYAAEAIENMALIEAIPNGLYSMNSKLITLGRGSNSIPYIVPSVDSVGANGTFIQGDAITFSGQTKNFSGQGTTLEEEYVFTITDVRLAGHWGQPGGTAGTEPTGTYLEAFSTVTHSRSIQGPNAQLVATDLDTLFPTTGYQRTCNVIMEGVVSTARVVIPVTITAD